MALPRRRLPRLQKTITRIGDGVLYSTIRLGTSSLASTTQQFFSYAQGSVAPGYTLASTVTETNMRQNGAMPGGQAFTVTGLALAFFLVGAKTGIVIADFYNMIDSTVLQWNFVQAKIEVAPASMVGSGGGAFGIAAGATINTQAITSGNGGYYRLKQPLVLAPLATFTVNWFFPASSTSNTADIGARLCLVGNYDIGIEAG